MSGIPDREATQKAARALELFEKGVDREAIAERLGVRTMYINDVIKRAKARREKAAEVTE